MNTPTHEDVTQRARQIWESYGRPDGRDTEIWLEAENQLAAESTRHGASEGQHHALATSDENALKAALQKKSARAPKVPSKTAPKSAPAETGKPLWSQPHSS